jgi:hypothetical protein
MFNSFLSCNFSSKGNVLLSMPALFGLVKSCGEREI